MQPSYVSLKTKNKAREKIERTTLERKLNDWIESIALTNTLLLVIAMILAGVFVNLVFS